MPAIEPHHKKNFDTLVAAAVHGDLMLMDCTDKATGKPVRVIVAAQRNDDDGQYILTPLARMFDADPYETLLPPECVTLHETEDSG